MGKDIEERLLRRVVIRAKAFEAMSVRWYEERGTKGMTDGSRFSKFESQESPDRRRSALVQFMLHAIDT